MARWMFDYSDIGWMDGWMDIPIHYMGFLFVCLLTLIQTCLRGSRLFLKSQPWLADPGPWENHQTKIIGSLL